MSPSVSRSLDCILYHQYLRGDSHSSNTSLDSLVDFQDPQILEQDDSSGDDEQRAYHWDLQATSKNLEPALSYISRKLNQENLSIALIVSDHSPFVIPVWPLPRKSQLILARIIRKACKKFDLRANWMTSLSVLSKRAISQVLDTYQPDSYIVRRSIIQHQVIFTEEGLTLLSIDHIYTFKQLMCTLSKPDWVSDHARQACLNSCVNLLHRIRGIYTGKPASQAYIARVYPEIPFYSEILDEVCCAYNSTYCTATIYDVASQPDIPAILADSPIDIAELPASRSSTPFPYYSQEPQQLEEQRNEDLVSPISNADLSTIGSWDAYSTTAVVSSAQLHKQLFSADSLSPRSVTYPIVRPPTSPPSAEYAAPSTPLPSSPPPRHPLHVHKRSLSPTTTLPPASPPPPYPPPRAPGHVGPRASHTRSTSLADRFPLPPPRAASRADSPLPPLLPSTIFTDEPESATTATADPQTFSPVPIVQQAPGQHKPLLRSPPRTPEPSDPQTITATADVSSAEGDEGFVDAAVPEWEGHYEEEEDEEEEDEDEDEEEPADEDYDDDEEEDIDDETRHTLFSLGLSIKDAAAAPSSAPRDRKSSWDEILQSPAAYIESWSSGVIQESESGDGGVWGGFDAVGKRKGEGEGDGDGNLVRCF